MKHQKLYQGSRKTLYQSHDEYSLMMFFSDKIITRDKEVLEIPGKGIINNNLSAFIMQKLDMLGIENHLIEKMNMREQLIQFVDIIPLKLSISTVACGRYAHSFGLDEGYVFDSPIIDYYIKNRDLNYPVVNEFQIKVFGWMSQKEINVMQTMAMRIYDFLVGLFAGIGIRVAECTLEFGRVFNGEEFLIILADEISFDNCHLRDINNNKSIGFENIKDSCQDHVIHSCQNILKRFNIGFQGKK